MFTYRVTFKDSTSVIIRAASPKQAWDLAEKIKPVSAMTARPGYSKQANQNAVGLLKAA